MTDKFQHFGVIGAGAWGTALAISLQRAGRRVTVGVREAELVTAINEKHENTLFLPGVALDPAIRATGRLGDLATCDALVLVTPAQHVRATCRTLAPLCDKKRPLIIAAKGIELHNYRLMSEVADEVMPGHPVFILSGPSFAIEVAQGLPSALTLAGEREPEILAHAMSSPNFRLYTSDDIIGTQIGGAVKNVLAIACGIVAGKKLGENAKAALITRGLAEIIRLGQACGARAETLMGLSGLGDTVLTCSSLKSRNMSLGYALGEGKSLGHSGFAVERERGRCHRRRDFRPRAPSRRRYAGGQRGRSDFARQGRHRRRHYRIAGAAFAAGGGLNR